MPESKRIMLESRLSKRLRKLSMDSYSTYVDYVFSETGSEGELINMIDAVTTNKTDFFRESDHFQFLLDHVAPEYLSKADPRPIACWSAGCSTGEEPYTIAMVLASYRERNPGFDYSILATDVSTVVLARAQDAVYSAEQAEPIPQSYKKKYLLKSRNKAEGLVRIRPELRSKVEFGRINFMDDNYQLKSSFDLVFCRNVIIYFERVIQEAILRKILRNIRAGGWLFLGHSETITGMELPMKIVAPTVYRKTH